MNTNTPDHATKLHQPTESAAGATVFAFDRDATVDVNPPRSGKTAVPLDWLRYLAHDTEHIVYATGNQDLKGEAQIPGIGEIVDAHPEDTDAATEVRNYNFRPGRRDRVRMLGELYPDASEYIVVDDVDLSDLDDWTHYYSWDFVPAAREDNIVSELPPSQDEIEAVNERLPPVPDTDW